jgi:hypothetical protein
VHPGFFRGDHDLRVMIEAYFDGNIMITGILMADV